MALAHDTCAHEVRASGALHAVAGRPLPLAARYIKERLAVLHPAYFALAMATGIVAIACSLLGLREFSTALSWLNLGLYPTLWLVFIARAVCFPARMLADCSNHARAPGYFTVVAATGVVGVQAVMLHDYPLVALGLWWGCVTLWALCTYLIFAMLTVRSQKPDLAEGINGGWLVAVVATQSVVVLGCALDGAFLSDRDGALFILLGFWLGGGMLYLWIIGLIFYRYMFFRFSPDDLMPPYWINMGAVAISTLAGALLTRAVESSAPLVSMRPFILGLTCMFWATASWWIPMLLVLGIWRHGVCRLPIRYSPLYWGLVFPIGMYSVCSFRLAEVFGISFLFGIAKVGVVAALATWLLTFLGLAQRILYALLLCFHQTRKPAPAEPIAQGQRELFAADVDYHGGQKT